MTATKIIHTITKAEDGLEIQVAEITNGFSVVIRDTDADEVYPGGRIFPTSDRAIKFANEIGAKS